MATTFALTVSCEKEQARLASRCLSEVHEKISRLEREISEFLPESPVYQLNQGAPYRKIAMTRAGIELIARSERLKRLTQGCFDYAAKSLAQPESGAIGWDPSALKAWRLGTEVHIGFGAVGKGYALDLARLILEQSGFRNYRLSAGGSSLIFSGFSGPGNPWSWGWTWEKDSDGDSRGIRFKHWSGETIALGVSGTHEKGNHILDSRQRPPRLGLSAKSALIATTSAADADALSTSLFVSGYAAACDYMRELVASPAMAEVDANGDFSWNGIFQRLWGAPGIEVGAQPRVSTRLSPFRLAPLLAAVTLAPGLTTLAIAESMPQIQASPPPATEAPQADVAATPTDSPGSAEVLPEEDALDLGSMSANAFSPYSNDRNPWWALLPLSALAVVLIHLKKVRRTPVKKTAVQSLIVAITLSALIEKAQAVDIEPLATALLGVVGNPKVVKKTISGSTIVFAKNAKGKAEGTVAFIEKNLWGTNCTHTWIIGIGKDGKVTQVRAQEMSCPHAFPAKEASFLDQYKGKGPADLAKLNGDIETKAKATGSCELATEAVKKAVTGYQKIKGQI